MLTLTTPSIKTPKLMTAANRPAPQMNSRPRPTFLQSLLRTLSAFAA